MGVRARGFDKLVLKLGKLENAAEAISPFVKLAGEHVAGYLKTYPTPPGGRKQPFKTAKQRRYFFYALKNGLIKVPYGPRTNTLSKRWTIRTSRGGLRVTIGNNTVYAPWVQGPAGTQSFYHKTTGWRTVDDAARVAVPEAVQIIEKGIGRLLNE